MSDRSRGRIVRESDVNYCLVFAVRPESNYSVLLDHRTRRALPGDQPVGFHLCDHGLPFDQYPGRPGHRPVLTAVAHVFHLADTGHKVREVLVTAPELKN